MAKNGQTSATNGRSSGQKLAPVDDPFDALYKELGSIGKTAYPLDPAALLLRELLLDCPAIAERAGRGASRGQRAQAASEVLGDLIVGLPDETDRRIAEAAFAYDSDYQGKPIHERQALLYHSYGISENMYADRRRDVFSKLIYGLRAGSAQATKVPGDGVLSLHPAAVGRIATLFYFATVATRLLVSERIRLLGPDAPLLREPNAALYSCHVRFLLLAHRYLHTIDELEVSAQSHLEPLLNEIIANGPFHDSIYLAHVYGGLDEPRHHSTAPNYSADRRLRGVWRDWYEYQDRHGADVGSALHSISTATVRFRNTLPLVSGLNTQAARVEAEKQSGIELARDVLEQYLGFGKMLSWRYGKRVFPRVLTDIFSTQEAKEQWLADMSNKVESIVILENHRR